MTTNKLNIIKQCVENNIKLFELYNTIPHEIKELNEANQAALTMNKEIIVAIDIELSTNPN